MMSQEYMDRYDEIEGKRKKVESEKIKKAQKEAE